MQDEQVRRAVEPGRPGRENPEKPAGRGDQEGEAEGSSRMRNGKDRREQSLHQAKQPRAFKTGGEKDHDGKRADACAKPGNDAETQGNP